MSIKDNFIKVGYYDLFLKSMEESLENKRKLIYNNYVDSNQIIPYDNKALLDLVDYIDNLLKGELKNERKE